MKSSTSGVPAAFAALSRTTIIMEVSHFTRPFPRELEHEILGTLGQRDLIITALVCQRFRDISVSLLFRHIARWSTFVGDEGKPQYDPLPRSYLALFRIIDEPALGRHVRFLDVCARKLLGSWPYDTPRRASKEDLHMLWLSMPGLIALSITGSIHCGPDLGLTDVHFPRLKRLRMDEPEECPEFVIRHLNTLTHLRISHDSKLSIGNATAVALAQYEGPFDIFMQQLRFRSEALESCTLMGDVGEHVALSLASLTNLRRLLLGLRINEKTMLELLSSCDKFPRVEDVVICYDDENDVRPSRVTADLRSLLMLCCSVPFSTNLRGSSCSRPSQVPVIFSYFSRAGTLTGSSRNASRGRTRSHRSAKR